MASYNNLAIPEAEKMVQCPYHKAHMVTKFRFAKHLDKCRRSYTGPELAKCRFNNTHFFQREEMAKHERICSDRLFIERSCYDRKTEPEKRKIEADEDDETGAKKSKAQGSDRWDDEEEEEESSQAVPMTDRKKLLENSTAIIHFQHMTKSQREAARKEHHQKALAIEEMLKKEELTDDDEWD